MEPVLAVARLVSGINIGATTRTKKDCLVSDDVIHTVLKHQMSKNLKTYFKFGKKRHISHVKWFFHAQYARVQRENSNRRTLVARVPSLPYHLHSSGDWERCFSFELTREELFSTG